MPPFGKTQTRLTWATTCLAGVLFIPLFIMGGAGQFDFWWWMSANVTILLSLVAIVDQDWRNQIRLDIKNQLLMKIFLGIVSSLFLYIVFYIGNMLSRQMLSFAGNGIRQVYAFKTGVSATRITLLIALLIGPGEELFWRGFVQRRLQLEQGRWPGFFIASAIYASIHLGSNNLMLVLAAGVCGLFWGFLYLQKKSLLLNMVSHTLWDVAIFLWFPLSG